MIALIDVVRWVQHFVDSTPAVVFFVVVPGAMVVLAMVAAVIAYQVEQWLSPHR